MTATDDRVSDAVNQFVAALVTRVTTEIEQLAPQLLSRAVEHAPPSPLPVVAPKTDEWITVAEAAKRSRRSPDTVRLALAEYVRSSHKRGLRGSQERPGCSWRIRPADLAAWMDGELPKRRRPS